MVTFAVLRAPARVRSAAYAGLGTRPCCRVASGKAGQLLIPGVSVVDVGVSPDLLQGQKRRDSRQPQLS